MLSKIQRQMTFVSRSATMHENSYVLFLEPKLTRVQKSVQGKTIQNYRTQQGRIWSLTVTSARTPLLVPTLFSLCDLRSSPVGLSAPRGSRKLQTHAVTPNSQPQSSLPRTLGIECVCVWVWVCGCGCAGVSGWVCGCVRCVIEFQSSRHLTTIRQHCKNPLQMR